MEIVVRNVNHAFSEVFQRLRALNLKPEQTRNGPALVFPSLVTTVYRRPRERVLFHQGRDANPIFHLMESVWMLAGRCDVAFLKQFVKRMADFSDDGETFNAAYGYRWRNHFGHDQLVEVIELLRRDPTTRQAVVQIWDHTDLTRQTRDKACNTQIVFDIRNGGLNMTVFNRSNDIWWGAYGANAVHFSVLQEVVASAVNYPVGEYRQVSNNFHLYTEIYSATQYVEEPPVRDVYDLYYVNKVQPRPIMFDDDYESFLLECRMFCEDPFNVKAHYFHTFFTDVAYPVAMVQYVRRNKISDGRDHASTIQADDWRIAVQDWIDRREARKTST